MTDMQKRKKKDFTLLWVWVIVFLTIGAAGGVYYYFGKGTTSNTSGVDTSALKSPFEDVNKAAGENKTTKTNGRAGSLSKKEY